MSDNHVGEGLSTVEDGDSKGVSPTGFDNGTAEIADNSVNQLGSTLDLRVDPVDQTNGIMPDPVQQDPNDTRVAEDGGREDMFVDCPDDMETSETQQTSEEKDDTQTSEEKDDTQSIQLKESDNGIKIQNIMTEMEQLRDMYENCVFEKDRIVQGYEEERAAIFRELAHLCHQVKGLNEQLPLPSENGESSLIEMISECSKFLDSALQDRLETEGKIRELQSILNTKDQEIDLLNAKVAELSESSNVVQSDLTSKHELLSQSYEAQLDNNRRVEEITNRTIDSLSKTVHVQESPDESLEGKISHVEKNVAHLIQKNNTFISEINHLRLCLAEVVPDLNVPDEIGVFATACDKLLEFKKKEETLYQSVSHLEDENRKLVEQLDEHKVMVENANGEIRRLSVELEQEKTKYSNTKEKLSMAVTKGKALVQQRDLLKQSLAEKTSEIEKCLIELQEKSSALEAAERTKELLAESQNLATSLQESLMDKDKTLQKCGEILADSVVIEELQSMDIVDKLSWILDEMKSMKTISVEYYKLTDVLSSFDFPETMLSSSLDDRARWLVESFSLSREEAVKLRRGIEEAKEAARNEIDHLTASLLAETREKGYLQAELEHLTNESERNEMLQHEVAEANEATINEIDRLNSLLLAETQEKTYLQVELDDLRQKYEEIRQTEYQNLLEKDRLVNMLLEASGIAKPYQEEVYEEQPDMTMIIEKCLAKIKEDASHLESPQVEMETFRSFQSLLYIRDQELKLHELIVAEDLSNAMEAKCLSDELKIVTQEIVVLKDDKAALQKNLEQLEEKNAVLREKLSMAVKKGKGLVQERENLKGALNEKNSEIDKLKTELQQQVSKLDECQDRISKLLLEVKHIPQLEADIVAVKEHETQLEKFLIESNGMLQRVLESIDGIKPSVNLGFEEPVEKIKWIAGYVGECETAKMEVEQELRKVKDETISFVNELSEAQTKTKSLEDSLSEAESKISLLVEEKKELQVVNSLLEDELRKAVEEASSQTRRFEEVHSSRRSLEDSLSLAENKIAKLMSERDLALESTALAEEQLQKLKEEFSINNTKLSEADNTIQALQDALYQAQKNVLLLTEENNKSQTGRVDLDNEMKKLKEEGDLQASNLADASLTIKSLENALLNAENNLADLVNAKENAEQETLALNTKLNACMQELAGKDGTLKSRSLEFSGHLSRLHTLVKDESLLLMLQECFEKKFESLKDMDHLLKEIKVSFHEMDSDVLPDGSDLEDDLPITSTFPSSLHHDLSVEMVDGELNSADDESVLLHVGKLVEGFYLKDKILADKLDKLSRCMDESNIAMLRKLHTPMDRMTRLLELIKTLNKKVKDVETDKQRQEGTLALLESNIGILFSACAEATQELELDVQNNISELRSVGRLFNLDENQSMQIAGGDETAVVGSHNYEKIAEKLLFATRHSRDICQQFQDAISRLVNSIEDMQKKLEKAEITRDEALKERDVYKDRIFKLETDLEARQNLCNEMSLELESYQLKEARVRDREAEISSQVQGSESSLLSSSQMNSLFDKLNEIEVPDSAFAVKEVESHDSVEAKKLFYVLDGFNELHWKLSSLSQEKEELQSILDEQVLDIEHLKREVESHMRNKNDSENIKNELGEIETGLKNIIRKLGGNEFVADYRAGGAIWLLPILDKLVMATILESENLKSKTDELKAKLLGTQKVVDDLSSKVKLLEDSDQARNSPSETGQERGISKAPLASSSEISEIQDMGALGKSNILPPVPSAAHARTLRKGSSDQLAIDIDSESERLVDKKNEDDDDKGHIFKSLNTSGLVPRQGRTVADRIDGIWVSGSRALMSRPRARLSFIAYWLVLHVWLLGAIL